MQLRMSDMTTVNIDWKYLTVARPRSRCEEDFYTK